MPATPTVLDEIIAGVRLDLADRVARTSLADLEARIATMPPALDAEAALRAAPGIAVIAEVKKASPSRGLLCRDFDPARLAQVYVQGGAAAYGLVTPGRVSGTTVELEYTTQTVEQPRFVIVGRNDTTVSHDTITVTNAASAVVHGGSGNDILRHTGNGDVRVDIEPRFKLAANARIEILPVGGGALATGSGDFLLDSAGYLSLSANARFEVAISGVGIGASIGGNTEGINCSQSFLYNRCMIPSLLDIWHPIDRCLRRWLLATGCIAVKSNTINRRIHNAPGSEQEGVSRSPPLFPNL